jgi:hypothetical protein
MDMHTGFDQASKTDVMVRVNLHNSTLYQSLVVNENEYCEIYDSGLEMSLDLHIIVS